MRTKVLLLTAALGLVGIAGVSAQSVYSVNAVGYVNLALPQGYALIANPLNGTNNLLSTILPNVPGDTLIYKFNSGSQQFEDANTFFDGFGWFPDNTLAPGEGAFIGLPSAATITFVGEVPQGQLTNQIPANYSLKGSQVPQSGFLTAALGYTPVADDVVYQWDRVNQRYLDANTYFDGFGWFPAEPNITVGESFFLQTTTLHSWTRSFSVN